MTLLETLVSSQAWSTSALIILITTIGLAFLPIIRRPSFPSIAPLALEKGTLPVIGGLGFFTRRANFLGAGREASKSGQFSFHYGPHPIVAVSGEAGRSTYYTTRGLDLAAGFRHLFAGGPDTSSVYDGDLTAYMAANFKRFTARERLGAGLSTLTDDTIQTIEPLRQKAKAAGGDGTVVVDIFDTYFRLVYQLTQRTLGCNDIADDPKLLETTLNAYKRLDVGSATEIMFPWLLTPTKIRKMWAGYTLFSRISNIVKERRKTGKSDNDALQVLIDNGDHEVVISTFVIAALFAGLLNSGINAAWILCYLAETPDWHARCLAEVNAALNKHRHSPNETPADILSRLTMDDWESDFGSVDLCLRETIRMNMPGVSARQNLSGQDIKIKGTSEVIPKNMFAVYLIDDVHMNADIYSNPNVWDPSRYLPDRAEDKKVEHGYLGWGTGLHPCLGMRFAKLEITISTVMFMAYFDFKLSNETGGKRVRPLPLTDRNLLAAEIPKEKIYLSCTPKF